jgi:hypothetical protein
MPAQSEERPVSTDEPQIVERPEDEDYDLLTYGEVAARLSEVLAEERQRLDDLRAAVPSDPSAVAVQEARIAGLIAGRDRYAQQAATAETFMRRFGLQPRARD